MALKCLFVGQSLRNLQTKTKCVSAIRKHAHKFTQAEIKPNKYKAVYRDLHGSIEDSSTARDFVYALDKHERTLLQLELQKFGVKETEPSGKTFKYF